jgi:hypothetical protein
MQPSSAMLPAPLTWAVILPPGSPSTRVRPPHGSRRGLTARCTSPLVCLPCWRHAGRRAGVRCSKGDRCGARAAGAGRMRAVRSWAAPRGRYLLGCAGVHAPREARGYVGLQVCTGRHGGRCAAAGAMSGGKGPGRAAHGVHCDPNATRCPRAALAARAPHACTSAPDAAARTGSGVLWAHATVRAGCCGNARAPAAARDAPARVARRVVVGASMAAGLVPCRGLG